MISTAAVAVLMVAACAPQHHRGSSPTPHGGPRGQISDSAMGTVIGGIAGGFLGSQFGEGGGKIATSIAGTLIGAWAGNQIANNLSRSDGPHYQEAAQEAAQAPVGEPIQWYNPETGHGGTVTATREGSTSDGRYCREFQQTITVGGKTEQAYGQACRQPDGSWQIVN